MAQESKMVKLPPADPTYICNACDGSGYEIEWGSPPTREQCSECYGAGLVIRQIADQQTRSKISSHFDFNKSGEPILCELCEKPTYPQHITKLFDMVICKQCVYSINMHSREVHIISDQSPDYSKVELS